MAFTYGFYNSKNHDRPYNAEQMSAIFDGVIKDGVFSTIGNIFAVAPGEGLQVTVDTGKAWFNHTWNVNDSIMPLPLATADVQYSRIDAVVLEINRSDESRTNTIRIVQGSPASSPQKPELTRSGDLFQYPLAYVTVDANAVSIDALKIEKVVGQDQTPFVTGILESVDISSIYTQWNAQFNLWFDNVKAQLEDNVVTNLQRQIELRLKISDKATEEEALAGVDDTKYLTPATGKKLGDGDGLKIGSIVTTTDPNPISDKWVRCDGVPRNKADYPEYAKNPYVVIPSVSNIHTFADDEKTLMWHQIDGHIYWVTASVSKSPKDLKLRIDKDKEHIITIISSYYPQCSNFIKIGNYIYVVINSSGFSNNDQFRFIRYDTSKDSIESKMFAIGSMDSYVLLLEHDGEAYGIFPISSSDGGFFQYNQSKTSFTPVHASTGTINLLYQHGNHSHHVYKLSNTKILYRSSNNINSHTTPMVVLDHSNIDSGYVSFYYAPEDSEFGTMLGTTELYRGLGAVSYINVQNKLVVAIPYEPITFNYNTLRCMINVVVSKNGNTKNISIPAVNLSSIASYTYAHDLWGPSFAFNDSDVSVYGALISKAKNSDNVFYISIACRPESKGTTNQSAYILNGIVDIEKETGLVHVGKAWSYVTNKNNSQWLGFADYVDLVYADNDQTYDDVVGINDPQTVYIPENDKAPMGFAYIKVK